MTHYTCADCGAVAENPGTCQTAGCEKNGQELQSCDCEDASMHSKKEHGSNEGSTTGKES